MAALRPAETAPPPRPLAESLGGWLGWGDAIALSTALDGASPSTSPTPAPDPTSAVAELARVKARLTNAIHTDASFASGGPRTGPPSAHAEPDADFSALKRSYVEHQRAMEASIGPLRESVRSLLARTSPALGRLAALDAAMQQALRAREQHLLGSVPSHLGRHHARMLRASGEASGDPPATDASDPRPAATGWPPTYRRDLRDVLLAELETRLQPVQGLIAALANETSRQP